MMLWVVQENLWNESEYKLVQAIHVYEGLEGA